MWKNFVSLTPVLENALLVWGRTARICYNGWATIEHLARLIVSELTSGLIAQCWTSITHLAFISGFLLQFTHSSLFWRLALVDKSCWKLDTCGLDRRAVLKDDHGRWWLVRMAQNRCNSYSINSAGLASLAGGCLPDPFLSGLSTM